MTHYYIAATFGRFAECEEYKKRIENAHLGRVVSTWHTDATLRAEEALGADVLTTNPEAGLPMAIRDLEDLGRANAMLFLSGGDAGRGGKHVEFGYALGTGMPIIIIGERTNVFCCLRGIERYTTFDAFLAKAVRDDDPERGQS